jgi:hypothetical protein
MVRDSLGEYERPEAYSLDNPGNADILSDEYLRHLLEILDFIQLAQPSMPSPVLQEREKI